MRKALLVAGTLAVTLLACEDRNFNRPSLLDKPRILAVRADPPQPSFGVATTLSTLLYQPPLDHVPGQCSNPGPTTYHWSWCPWPMSAGTDYQCPFPEDAFKQLYASLGLGTPPSYELGEGEAVSFTNPFPAQFLYALCHGDIGSSLGGTGSGAGTSDAGSGRSVFNCDLPAEDYNTPNASDTHPIGFKVTIKVEITPSCPSLLPSGFSPLVAVYTLHLPTNDAIPVNQNPVLDGILATQYWSGSFDGGADSATGSGSDSDGDSDGGIASDDGGGATAVDGGEDVRDAGPGKGVPDGSVALDDEPSVTVKRDKHVGLALQMDITTAEHLAVPSTIDYDSVDKLTRHYEHLDIAWYAEAGDFTGEGKGENTGFLPTALPAGQDTSPSENATDRANFEFNRTNTWDLPKKEDYQPDTARIIVVVRDGRGGVTWSSKVVRLEKTP